MQYFWGIREAKKEAKMASKKYHGNAYIIFIKTGEHRGQHGVTLTLNGIDENSIVYVKAI